MRKLYNGKPVSREDILRLNRQRAERHRRILRDYKEAKSNTIGAQILNGEGVKISTRKFFVGGKGRSLHDRVVTGDDKKIKW
jgi:hypothetical protein